MIRGSCLCGEVRCQLEGARQFLNHCHCSQLEQYPPEEFWTGLQKENR